MTTLANLEVTASRALRDPNNATFQLAEVDDILNSGIDAIADFFPKEVMDASITISAGVSTYAVPATFTSIFRVDIWSAAGSTGTFLQTLEPAIGAGPNSGWEHHAGTLLLPPSVPIPTGDNLHLFGYGGYIQLSASSSVTDLPSTAITALMVYVQVEAYDRMQLDRVMFQQWQAMPGNNDVSLLQLFRIAANWHARWDRERVRLRSIRKQG